MARAATGSAQLGAPDWLAQVLRCPVDRGALTEQPGAFRCARCGREYALREGIAQLVPEEIADLSAERSGGDSRLEWLSGELEWWESHHQLDSGRPAQPHAGLRGRTRERRLLRHVRDEVGERPLVVEMGAGTSRTVAGLWPPSAGAIRYVATDLSEVALRAGARAIGPAGAAVRCEAGSWPFAEASVDVVLVLGVLHHLPDWQEALRRACASVRPGGFMVLHEVIEKPRFLASGRSGGICDGWTSPHEGKVSAQSLRSMLEEQGTIERWRPESTPLRFALVYYGDLHERLEDSRALTVGIDLLDQAFGRSVGAVAPSLGFSEVACLWRRA